MPDCVRDLVGVLVLVVAAGGLVGCGGGETSSEYGDWTLKEDGLTLTEDLRVSETEAYFFGSITDLDVTSDGRIVVADQRADHLKMLRPDGALIDTLGREGGGPGEFQRLVRVQVARGDSLYAYDMQPSRLTVFGPEAPYEVSRTLSVSGASNLHVLDKGFVGVTGSRLRPEEGVSRPDPSIWRRIDASGTPGDTLLRTRLGRIAINQGGGRGFQFGPIPYDRESIVRKGPDGRLYHGWTDSLYIKARGPGEGSEVVASIPTDPVPITEAGRDSALAEVEDGLRSIVASALPNTKPAFTDLVVADDGRLWVKRPAEGARPDAVPWWILDPETKTIRTVRLPPEVDLEVVKDGRAYGTTTTEMGAPALVRYRVGD